MPKKKRLVHLSDEEEGDDEANSETNKANNGGFISAKIIDKFHEKLINRDKYLEEILKHGEAIADAEFEEEEVEAENQKTSVSETEPYVIELSDDDGDVPKLPISTKKGKKQKMGLKKLRALAKSNDSTVDELLKQLNDIDDKFHRDSFEIELVSKEPLLEESISNKPMRIKVKRLNRIECFSLLRTEPISTILDDISGKFNIPVPKIILYLNDSIIDAKSTPNSLNLSVADIFEVLCRFEPDDSSNATTTAATSTASNDDPNFIELHLRDSSKKRLTIRINRFETVEQLALFYAKSREISPETVTLIFDDEPMVKEKKIDFYELENEDQIDVCIKQQ